MKVQKGFTLIEMMVVVAIIGILAAISLQGYTQYMARAASRACMAEAKAFVTQLSLAQANSSAYPAFSILSACRQDVAETTPSGGQIDANTTAFKLFPKAPGLGNTSCTVQTLVCTMTGF
uniref:pilin n=1 Tax=Roseateles sp. TaxID=1971397 RepID=UPI003BA575B7